MSTIILNNGKIKVSDIVKDFHVHERNLQRKFSGYCWVNDKGEWFEIGEYSSDGEKWYQFFEMTLQRVGK